MKKKIEAHMKQMTTKYRKYSTMIAQSWATYLYNLNTVSNHRRSAGVCELASPAQLEVSGVLIDLRYSKLWVQRRVTLTASQ